MTEKAKEFEEKLIALQQEYKDHAQLYAANAVLENGEVVPVIKINIINEIKEEKNEDIAKK